MACDVIIGKGALNFPCEIADRGHDGPHATPSILGSVQARQAWEAQKRAREAQPVGVPYQNYQGFQDGAQHPHPRQLVKCFFCPAEVAYEEFYQHIGTHAAQPRHTASYEPQGPAPGTPSPSPSGVVGASSAQALAEHIARHPANPTSPTVEAAGHMAEVMGYPQAQPQSQPIPAGVYEAQFGNGQSPSLMDEVQRLLNRYSRENMSNTPDFILAEYLMGSLAAYENAVNSRDSWYQLSQEGPTS
jgi:hypothetical protein